MRELIDAREWLTVFLLPAYSPDLNPVDGVWAHVKHTLADPAVVVLDRLETLVCNWLKRLQYRPKPSTASYPAPASPLATRPHPDEPKSVG